MDYNATLTAQQLGLLPNDYNLMMGEIGLIIGSFFFYFTIKILIDTSRGF